MIIQKDSVVLRNPAIIDRVIDGEIVLLDPQSGEFYGSQFTGNSIWSKLDKPIRVSDLITMLVEEYNTNADVITMMF